MPPFNHSAKISQKLSLFPQAKGYLECAVIICNPLVVWPAPEDFREMPALTQLKLYHDVDLYLLHTSSIINDTHKVDSSITNYFQSASFARLFEQMPITSIARLATLQCLSFKFLMKVKSSKWRLRAFGI